MQNYLSKITYVLGDITSPEIIDNIDVIVNAANNTLLGGGGVDYVIHKSAGPELLEECRRIGGCYTGEAVITKAYNIPCKNIIHTVGPIHWTNIQGKKDELLAACYYNSLKLAVKNGLRTIAFPAISTGEYDYPLDEALEISIYVICKFLEELEEQGNNDAINEIRLVYYNKSYYDKAKKCIDDIKKEGIFKRFQDIHWPPRNTAEQKEDYEKINKN